VRQHEATADVGRSGTLGDGGGRGRGRGLGPYTHRGGRDGIAFRSAEDVVRRGRTRCAPCAGGLQAALAVICERCAHYFGYWMAKTAFSTACTRRRPMRDIRQGTSRRSRRGRRIAYRRRRTGHGEARTGGEGARSRGEGAEPQKGEEAVAVLYRGSAASGGVTPSCRNTLQHWRCCSCPKLKPVATTHCY
jgi:hypothetical protein